MKIRRQHFSGRELDRVVRPLDPFRVQLFDTNN